MGIDLWVFFQESGITVLWKMEQPFEFIEHITDNFLFKLYSGYFFRKAAGISC